ncbi:hypothetical protein [Myxosarcina sp. GI1(2024)]
MLLIVIFASWKTNLPVSSFTKDIASIADVNPFNGVISNLGILLWCAAASICLFSFAVLQNLKTNHASIQKKFRFFLLVSGSIGLIIMFDDLFLLHEEILPSLNISEKAVFLSYMIMICLYLLKFRKTILKTEWIVLCLGLLCFAASIIIDILVMSGKIIFFDKFFFEDGLKLLAIASWFSYFVRLCFQILKNTIDPVFYYDRRHKFESVKSIS